MYFVDTRGKYKILYYKYVIFSGQKSCVVPWKKNDIPTGSQKKIIVARVQYDSERVNTYRSQRSILNVLVLIVFGIRVHDCHSKTARYAEHTRRKAHTGKTRFLAIKRDKQHAKIEKQFLGKNKKITHRFVRHSTPVGTKTRRRYATSAHASRVGRELTNGRERRRYTGHWWRRRPKRSRTPATEADRTDRFHRTTYNNYRTARYVAVAVVRRAKIRFSSPRFFVYSNEAHEWINITTIYIIISPVYSQN